MKLKLNLSKASQGRLVRVVIFTAITCGLCWALLIRPQEETLGEKRALARQVEEKIGGNRRKVQLADRLKDDIKTGNDKLKIVEEGIVRGDMYLWIIKTMRRFQVPGRVEISNYEPPQPAEVKGLPKLPYQMATFSIVGTAYYFDFVDFLQTFEAAFPHIRVQKIELEPASFGTRPEDEEKLTFKIEILALVKGVGTE